MQNHIEFPCIEVKQGERVRLYLGCLRFEDLKSLYSVSPREPRTDDPYFNDGSPVALRFPQRPEKRERLIKIAEFVRKRLEPSESSRKEVAFPGTVILGLLMDIETHLEQPDSPTPSAAHLIGNGTRCAKTILLPNRRQSLFVIDGQHRIKGLAELERQVKLELDRLVDHEKGLSEEQQTEKRQKEHLAGQIANFEIPISLLVDFDLEEQAAVFATVNFNQKPVQRSFYYDIFGSFESDKVTPISFTHELVVHLQNSEKSPLRGLIKLLGTGPGLISQAFLVARITPLIDPEHSKSVFRDFFVRRRQDDKEASRQFASIIRSFFEAVRTEFPYAWPKPDEGGQYRMADYQFILCKSMVVSGLLGLLRETYKLAWLDFAGQNESAVAAAGVFSREFFAGFLKHIDPEGRVAPDKSAFTSNSRWAIGGSAKVERLIFDELREQLLTAYAEAVANDASDYMKSCADFGGAKHAANLLNSLAGDERKEFWKRTEELWGSKTARVSNDVPITT